MSLQELMAYMDEQKDTTALIETVFKKLKQTSINYNPDAENTIGDVVFEWDESEIPSFVDSLKKLEQEVIFSTGSIKELILGLLQIKMELKKPKRIFFDSLLGTSNPPNILDTVRTLFPSIEIGFSNIGSIEGRTFNRLVKNHNIIGLYQTFGDDDRESKFAVYQYLGNGYFNREGKFCINQYSSNFKLTNEIKQSVITKQIALIQTIMMRINPKLYILVAPPGYGKSSIVDELRLHNFRMLRTVTTRVPRSLEEFEASEKEFVSRSEFDYLRKYDQLTQTINYQREQYAYRISDLKNIYTSGKHHICEMASVEEAVRLQQEHPDLVRLIFITPPRSFTGYGLEQRLKGLDAPSEGFSSVEEEIRYLTRKKETTQDTQRRLNQSVRDYTAYLKHIQFADLIVPSTTILKNTARIYDHIMQQPGLFETFRYVN